MIYLVSAFLFFFSFLTTHIVGYRLKIFEFQPVVLFWISVLWLGIYALFLQRVSSPSPLPLTSLTLYLLLCLGYIAETNVIENDSPSMKIVRLIQDHPRRRVSYQDLRRSFSNEEFIFPRLNDLVLHGHVAFDGHCYSLGPQGRLIARLTRHYRDFIRRGLGG